MASFDKFGYQPLPQSRPMCRQAFRPGQWSGMRFGTINKTYIQNNFYGPQSSYRDWGDAWAGSSYYDDSEPKMSTLGKIGLGATLLGGILACFAGKKGSKSNNKAEAEGGGTPVTDNSSTQNPANIAGSNLSEAANLNSSSTTVLPQTLDNPVPITPSSATEVDEFNWDQENLDISARDVDANGNDSAGTAPITGKVEVTKAGEKGKAPQTFTITTSEGNTYTFEKLKNTSADGKVQYKCTSWKPSAGTTPIPFTKGNVYSCEIKNGKPILFQKPGDDGNGESLQASNK